MEKNCNVCSEVFIRKEEIECYIEKKDVLLIKMKNGKTWVCSKDTDLNQNKEFIKIILANKGGDNNE